MDNRSWLASVYQSHHEYLTRVLKQLVGWQDSELLKDLSQAAWTQVAGNISHYRELLCSPNTWLYSCARSVVSNYRVSLSRKPTEPLGDRVIPHQSLDTPQSCLAVKGLLKAVKVIPSVSVDYEDLLIRLTRGYTGPEIAQSQGVSAPAIEKARKRIRSNYYEGAMLCNHL